MADETKTPQLIPAELFDSLLKDGHTTSEFKVTLVAKLLGAIAASGLIPADSVWFQIVGLLVIGVADVVYNYLRYALKTTDLAHRLSLAEVFAPGGADTTQLQTMIDEMRKKLAASSTAPVPPAA